ncbi:MAG: hypothetical protein V7K41_08970 [Nostoc sp.]|uniref:hypothetical protein n=1 Tax=Nostoc sp. TaxID=1180 RepID=UPI002FFC2A23
MRSPYFIFILSHEDVKAALFVIILHNPPTMQLIIQEPFERIKDAIAKNDLT